MWLSACAAHFCWRRSVAGRSVCCLASRLEVTERVLCFFGSCGLAAGVHALGSRLGPPIIEARRGVGLVASCFVRFRFPSARGGRAQCPWPCGRLLGQGGRERLWSFARFFKARFCLGGLGWGVWFFKTWQATFVGGKTRLGGRRGEQKMNC